MVRWGFVAGLELVLSKGLSAASVQSDGQESSRDPVWRRDSTCTFFVFRCFPRCLLVEVSLLLTECFLGMVLGDSSGMWLGLGTLGSFLQDLAGQYSDSSLERLPGQSCCAPPQVSSTDPNLQVFLLQTCY